MQKLYDVAAKIGEYKDRDGKTKGRWDSVGAIFRDDRDQNASPFLVLKRTFNPAGMPNPNGQEGAVLSLFKPQNNNSNNNSYSNSKPQSWSAKDTPDYSSGDADIPF